MLQPLTPAADPEQRYGETHRNAGAVHRYVVPLERPCLGQCLQEVEGEAQRKQHARYYGINPAPAKAGEPDHQREVGPGVLDFVAEPDVGNGGARHQTPYDDGREQ